MHLSPRWDGLPDGPARALTALAALGEQGSSAEWQISLSDLMTERTGKSLAEKTFHNWRQALLKEGLIEKLPGKGHFYRLTDAGRTATAKTLPSASDGSAP